MNRTEFGHIKLVFPSVVVMKGKNTYIGYVENYPIRAMGKSVEEVEKSLEYYLKEYIRQHLPRRVKDSNILS